MRQKYFWGFEFELLRVQPCWFTPYRWRAEQGWLDDVMYIAGIHVRCIHINIMDLVKLAVLATMFSWLSDVDLLFKKKPKQDYKFIEKLLWVGVFAFHFSLQDLWCLSLWVSFNTEKSQMVPLNSPPPPPPPPDWFSITVCCVLAGAPRGDGGGASGTVAGRTSHADDTEHFSLRGCVGQERHAGRAQTAGDSQLDAQSSHPRHVGIPDWPRYSWQSESAGES